MSPYALTTQTGHSHLQRLLILRCIAVAAQLATLGLVYRFLEMELHWLPMLMAILLLAGLSFLTWLRLRSSRPVSNAELFTQLCADVLALTVLLYYGGGSSDQNAATLIRFYTGANTTKTYFTEASFF